MRTPGTTSAEFRARMLESNDSIAASAKADPVQSFRIDHYHRPASDIDILNTTLAKGRPNGNQRPTPTQSRRLRKTGTPLPVTGRGVEHHCPPEYAYLGRNRR